VGKLAHRQISILANLVYLCTVFHHFCLPIQRWHYTLTGFLALGMLQVIGEELKFAE
jgi:hypothetical protein